jgi:predicted nucleic-acid-binding Zn-ribbon protein
MNEGAITCDKCGKEIAHIRASVQHFFVFETEPFTVITCADCKAQEGTIT